MLTNLYFLIILIPLNNFIILSLFGFKLGRFVSYCWCVASTIFISLIVWISILLDICDAKNTNVFVDINFGSWMISGTLDVDWLFMFDSLSLIMLSVVLTISLLVQIYSGDYMVNDPHIVRFLSYLSLFTFFMIVLVTAGNFFVLFLGWEGVGLCSYLLISFWYTRIEANKAALKALLMNRIGDFFIIFAMCVIFKYCKSLDFATIFFLSNYMSDLTILFFGSSVKLWDLVSFSLFLGVIGKSAQIGLHTWLPDAMEGPTPVSALIHAATMVTAGVYLVIRCSFLFQFSDFVLNLMIVVGLLTSLMAGLIGCAQWDIKKIIAYSTCSQLGFMVFVAGFSNFSFSFYHLVTHAYFKALLFLSAGTIIHFFSGEQDIRKMGSAASYLPYLYLVTLFANLSLIGFPYTSGFYSKDLILQSVLTEELSFDETTVQISFFSIDLVLYLLLFSVFLTAFYSFRLVYFVFLAEFSGFYSILKLGSNKFDWKVNLVFFILMIGSLFTGYFFKDIFLPSSLYFKDSICFGLTSNLDYVEFVPFWIKTLPFFCSFLAIFLVYGFVEVFSISFDLKKNKLIYFLNNNSLTNPILLKLKVYFNSVFVVLNSYFLTEKNSFIDLNEEPYYQLYHLINQKFYFDYIYNYIGLKIIYLSDYLYAGLDKGFLELFGPSGLDSFFTFLYKIVNRIHTGFLYQYLQIMFFLSFMLIFIVELLVLFY